MTTAPPPCRCEERREAMKRAFAAVRNGDHETYRREMRWIAQTSAEDLIAKAKYLAGTTT